MAKFNPHKESCSKYCAKQHCIYCSADAMHGSNVCYDCAKFRQPKGSQKR